MPSSFSSGVVPASADTVWELVRPFDGLPAWHPAITASELTSGAEGQVGAVRRLTLADGGIVVERLVALDDEHRSYTYCFAGENPFGVERYISTIKVCEVTDTGAAFVQWWAEFDADADAAAELKSTFSDDVYGVGIAGLKKRFA
ncbi:MAG: SRPBCC family protein [Micrococcales bacterium]|nr:SRPBCC family protein [Micrococcales bacterium]